MFRKSVNRIIMIVLCDNVYMAAKDVEKTDLSTKI